MITKITESRGAGFEERRGRGCQDDVRNYDDFEFGMAGGNKEFKFFLGMYLYGCKLGLY